MDPHSPPHPRNGFAREWFNIIKDRAPHAVHSDDKSGRSIRTTRPHSRGSSITSVESENNHHLRSTRIPAPRRSAISLRAAFEAAATPTTLPGSPSRKTHLSLNTSPKSHLPVKVRPKQSHESMNTGAMDNNNNNSGRGRHSQNGQSVDMTPRRREPSSSPPRGLREAYARIEYEEELAAAESPPENFGNDQIDWSGRHLIHPRDTLADTLHHPYPVLHPSIMSRPPPVMGSPRTRLQASPEHTLTLGDSTMGSGSGSPSVISGLSSLENGTEDSFVRTMAQHQRDQQRVSGALGGDQPVFSRAHHVNGVKDDKLGDIEVAEREVMEGSSSGPSEGEHILDQGGISKSAAEDHRRATLDLIKKVAHEAAQELTRDVEKGQQQQQQQQARPVSSEGNETSDGGTSSPSSTNKQRRRQRNRLNRREKMRRLREDNRTGKALISRKTSSGVKDDVFDLSRTEIETGAAGEDGTAVVTPITKAKMTVLERIREREMEKLKGQAVATSRLNQLGERSSKEHLRPRQSNIQGEEEGDGERLTIQEHEDNQEVTVEEHPNANATADEIKKDENNNNDDEKKSDPRDLLRQLARATSNSPSPKTAAAVLVQQVETSIPPTRDSTSEPTTSARTHEDVQPKTNEDAATNDDIDDNATPRAEKPQPIPDMTPAVAIGGWINTPTTTFFPSPSETTIRRRREESSSGGGGGIRSLIRGSGPPQHKKTQFHGDNDHDNDDSTMEMLEQFIAEDTLDFATSLKATEGEVKGIKEENLILKEEGDEEVKKSRNRDRDGDGEETKYICPECKTHHLHHIHQSWQYTASNIFKSILFRKKKDGRLKARWIWILLLTLMGWYLAERITCYFFCHLPPWEIDPFGYLSPQYPFAIFGTFRWFFPEIANPLAAYFCRNVPFVEVVWRERCDWLTWPDLYDDDDEGYEYDYERRKGGAVRERAGGAGVGKGRSVPGAGRGEIGIRGGVRMVEKKKEKRIRTGREEGYLINDDEVVLTVK